MPWLMTVTTKIRMTLTARSQVSGVDLLQFYSIHIYLDLNKLISVFWVFLTFDFCRFCVVNLFFIPATTVNDLWLRRFSIPYFFHYIYFPILILEKEPVFPFLLFSAKQGNYWYHFYNVFFLTRSLTGDWTRDPPHSKPALWFKHIFIRKYLQIQG